MLKVKTEYSKEILKISNYCFHYLFFLLILIRFKNINKFHAFLISLSIGLIYISLYDPVKVYKVKWSKSKYISIWIFIYMLILFIY